MAGTQTPDGGAKQGRTVEETAELFEGLLSAAAKGDEDKETPESEQPEGEQPEGEAPETQPEGEQPEGEQPEPEPEPEGEEETPEPEPEPETQPEKEPLSDDTEIEVDGEKVTLAELKNGRLRQKDYTQKTMAAAEARKAAEAREQSAREALDAYAASLQTVKSTLEAMVPKEPDWAEVEKTSTPEQYKQVRTQWDRYKARRAEIEAEQKRVAEAQADDNAKKAKDYGEREAKRLLEVLPDFADPAKAEPLKLSMVKDARERGFTDDELKGLVDSRLVLLLHDAMKWRSLQKAKPKVLDKIKGKPKIKTVAPGAEKQPDRTRSNVRDQARSDLQKTGRVDDAARLFANTPGLL